MTVKYRKGRVYLVGAGPGDPGLITVKGLEKLKQADAVVYDRLVNDDLLCYCREDCEKIFVGKESGFHPVEQEQITEILIRKSELGLDVVRLKGGNPFIFGRGSEEAIALARAGIDFEIIPGITSGLSAPVYSGIPITHRGMITQCVLITAHESPGKPGTQVEWDKLAKLKNSTLVIYMGASRIENICRELISHGADPSTPAAVIENGTLPSQRTITARLDNIADEFKANGFHAPAIIMISPTVAMRNEISWYENKPLFGKRIALVGNRNQLELLSSMVYDLGGEPLRIQLSNPDSLRTLFHGGVESEEEIFCANDEFPSNGPRYPYEGLNDNQLPLVSVQRTADQLYEEPRADIIEDLCENGADAFVFASSKAAESFFDTLGRPKGTKMIEHTAVVAVSRAAANLLAESGLRAIRYPSDCTAGALHDLLLNLFSNTQE